MTIAVSSCQSGTGTKALPYLGIPTEDDQHPSIPDYTFIDQLGREVTPGTFKDKVYVADFFFTSCPTICPKVTAEMLRVYREFEDNPKVMFLSHSIDTRHDSVPVLKKYADKLEIDHDRWRFITGVKAEIFGISKSYMSIVLEDPDAPGGYDHSGYLILVDKDRHIRSYSNGTLEEETGKLIADIHTLLKEN